jgi:hypothetical protein
MGAQMPGAMGGQMPPAVNPLMAQQLGGGGMAMGGGVPLGMPMNMGINPYAIAMPGGMTRILGIGVNPVGGGRRMRPSQMPDTVLDDEMSMSDRGNVGHGNLYSSAGMKAGGIRPRYTSPPGRQGSGDMYIDERSYHTGKAGRSILKSPGRGPMPRGRGRDQRPRGFDVGSDDSGLSPRQQGRKRVNGTRRARFDEITGKLSCNIFYMSARSYFRTGASFDDLDGEHSPQSPHPRRSDSTPMRPAPKNQAAYESDDDDAI